MTYSQNLVRLGLSSSVAACLFAQTAFSNPNPIAELLCAPSDETRQLLENHSGETLVWQGLRDTEQVMEIWENRQGDWTLTIAYANGIRCIVAIGTVITGFSDHPQG